MPPKAKADVHSEYLEIDNGKFVWIMKYAPMISKAREYASDMSWTLLRNRLKNQFSVEVFDDDWVGLMMLLSLKAAFHDGNGHPPHMFAPQSKSIDNLWHRYILTSTYWYDEWNKQIFGVSIHHTSLTSKRDSERCHRNTLLAIQKV